jgi:hypothetical protein
MILHFRIVGYPCHSCCSFSFDYADIGTRNRKKPERYEAANEEAKKKRGRPLGSKGKGVGKTTKGEKGKKKGKKVKDPNAPKRALSAYMHFAQENRAKVKEDNPNATFGQLGKLLGEHWQNASAAEKKVT